MVVHGANVQGHLHDCLDAIVSGPAAPVEVIVATTTPAAHRLAERFATQDPRLVPVPLADGTPDAVARSAGAARATAPWLHLVPAKDRVPAGAPRTVAELTAEQPPEVDVLLLDHVRSTWRTPGIPSPDGTLLARAGRVPRTLADCPALLTVTPLLGARVLRTAFWRAHPEWHAPASPESPASPASPASHGPSASYEPFADDAYLAYAALVHARRITALDQVVVDDRRLRPASLPPPTPAGAYAEVARYEAVQQLLAELDAPREVRAALYDVMVHAWLRTIARGDAPGPVARAFFHRAARAATRWRPPGHPAPEGLDGIRYRLLERDAHHAYRLVQGVNHKRREVRGQLVRRGRKVAAKLRDHRYRQALDRPVEQDLAVFSAYWDRGVACNPAAVAAKLAELAPDVRQVWVVAAAQVPLLPPGTRHVVPGTPRYWEVMARARYLVNNVNFPGAVVKRPDALHLQTHHGTPLKRMGLDQQDYPAAAQGLNFRALLDRVDKWDFSVSANAHSTETWERAYPSRYVSLDHGYPRNDALHRATPARIRAVRERLGVPRGRTVFLYAPTHRDYEAAWTPRLDLAELAAHLGEDTVILVRGHYFYGGAAAPGPLAGLRRDGRVIDVSGYDPVEDLQLAADGLITDYSSLMFDYANLDRPVVVYADDWETYARTRGVYFDLPAGAPGQVARTQDELTEVIRSGAWQDAAAAKTRAAFRRRFCEFDDGRAAERVVRRVFLGTAEEDLPPVVPVDERPAVPTPQEADAT
ncbi:CDP-glycerol glycerophosphotransferase family protein [Streptomyces sp. NPDC005955]|uniref:CDP-glycerol glycerophosphotransferase family protein n=1 Tax=Streptomyces sp. NPDC005955 TaxID=3364738 RepID=UPI00367F7308